MNIVEAFRDLHGEGYSYQDINNGSFFIDATTGDVRICDTDNVAPNRENLGVAGRQRFMAPEIVRNISRPDKYSDYFSLAVILFMLFHIWHPLEGRRFDNFPCMTEHVELKLYGKEPLFIFDPGIDLNRPHDTSNASRFWKRYPKFFRDVFCKAFSQESIRIDSADDLDRISRCRVDENIWRAALVNLRSCLVKCPSCGADVFLDMGFGTTCYNGKCGNRILKTLTLFFLGGKYRVPVYPGVEIRKCMVDGTSTDRSTVVGCISVNPQKKDMVGLKNCDSKPWQRVLNDGSCRIIEPGRSSQILPGDEIRFDHGSSCKVLG